MLLFQSKNADRRGGTKFKAKEEETYLLFCIDVFFKICSTELFKEAKGPNVFKILENHVENQLVPRSIKIDEAKRLIGEKS